MDLAECERNINNVTNKRLGKARINVPSTLGGNWTWRMEKGQFDKKAVERLNRMTWLYERLPEKGNKIV